MLPFLAILLLANPIAATKMVQSAIKVYRQNFLLPTKRAPVWTCSSLRAHYCNNRYILRWRCFFQFQKLDLECHYLKITGSNWNNKNKIKIKRLKIRKLKISWSSPFLLTTYAIAEYENKNGRKTVLRSEIHIPVKIILKMNFINCPHPSILIINRWDYILLIYVK